MGKIFKWIGIVVVAFIVLGVIGSMLGGNKGTTSTTTTTTTSQGTTTKSVDNTPKLTLATFNQIQTGQSLAQVEAVIGKGELSSENTIAGITTKMFTFKGDSLASNASIMFQDDKLMSKTQFGLK